MLAPKTGAGYHTLVRIIASNTLYGYIERHVPKRPRPVVKNHIDAWYEAVSNAKWKTTAEVRQQFGSASFVSDRVVFNLKGNDYRLIVKIEYALQIVFILWLGRHEEYDSLEVSTAMYQRSRYGHPTHS